MRDRITWRNRRWMTSRYSMNASSNISAFATVAVNREMRAARKSEVQEVLHQRLSLNGTSIISFRRCNHKSQRIKVGTRQSFLMCSSHSIFLYGISVRYFEAVRVLHNDLTMTNSMFYTWHISLVAHPRSWEDEGLRWPDWHPG